MTSLKIPTRNKKQQQVKRELFKRPTRLVRNETYSNYTKTHQWAALREASVRINELEYRPKETIHALKLTFLKILFI